MPRFAADLGRMFPERPLPERFAAAKAAGFDAVELPLPYDHPTQQLRDALVWNDLAFVRMNCPPPNATGGPAGFAAVPGLEDRFRRDFERTLRFAGVLKPCHIHIMAGAAEGPQAEATLIANLRWAAARAPRQSLTIAPVDRQDRPGGVLSDYDGAARVLAAVAAPNLGLLFDTGHAHRITGDVLGAWRAHGHRVVHVQIADFPGRREPQGGAIDHAAFLARLDAEGYRGWVGAAYVPAGSPAEDPGRMR